MDVTREIELLHRQYGSSDNTNPAYNSTNKSLNCASSGATIQNPEVLKVSTIPLKINFQDTVGLMGVENHFVRVNIDVKGSSNEVLFVNGYLEAQMIPVEEEEEVNTYEPAIVDSTVVRALRSEEEAKLAILSYGPTFFDTPINGYYPVFLTFSSLPNYLNPMVTVTLDNLGTGNQYIDSWLDCRLYTKDRQEHPYDMMLIGGEDYFYIGFHARNTRRLPYNITCTIGDLWLDGNNLPAVMARYKAKVN